jgi:hypothetical protein
LIVNKVNELRRKLKFEYYGNKIKIAIDKKKSIWTVLKEVTGNSTTFKTQVNKIRLGNGVKSNGKWQTF